MISHSCFVFPAVKDEDSDMDVPEDEGSDSDMDECRPSKPRPTRNGIMAGTHTCSCYDQWWEVTKYIYSSTRLKYNIHILVLHFILLLYYISDGNIVLYYIYLIPS